MNATIDFRSSIGLLHSAMMVIGMTTTSSAAPSFISRDPRLPNPGRPYVMKEAAEYGPVPIVHDLTTGVANPAQLDTPAPNTQGNWEFDSTFDVYFSAILSIGLAPSRFVRGTGLARAVGVAPGGGPILAPQVYDTELLALALDDLPDFMFRESPGFGRQA